MDISTFHTRTDGWIESMHESALEKYQDKKKWDSRKIGEGIVTVCTTL